MPSPLPQPLRAGQVPDARAWNDLLRTVAQGSHVSGSLFGEIGVAETAGGVQILDGRLRKHWAKITSRGTGNLYAHRSVAPNVAGGFADLPQDADNPYGAATTNGCPAREIHARVDFDASLPLYVELWPDEAGVGWLFDVGGAIPPGALSSSQSTPTAIPSATLITADDTWQDIAQAAVTLPSAGTYFLYGLVDSHAKISATPPGAIAARLYNVTRSSPIPGSNTYVVQATVVDIDCYGSGTFGTVYAAPGADTVRVQHQRGSGPTWTFSESFTFLDNGNSPITFVGYLKIA